LQVREATGDMPDVWINLAHVYVSQGLYLNAIKLYQSCLKKFYFNKDANILLFLSRAFFEAQRYEECKGTLLKALHLSPHSKSLWFNLALTQEQFATGILRKDKKQQALNDIKKAVNELKQAVVIFNRLSGLNSSGGPAVAFISQKAEKHATYCNRSLDLGKKQLLRAEEIEKNALFESERKSREVEALKEKQAREEAERIRRENEKKLEEDQEARKNDMKFSQLKQKWVKIEDDTPKRKGKKKDRFIDDTEEANVEINETYKDEPEETLEERRFKRSCRKAKERKEEKAKR